MRPPTVREALELLSAMPGAAEGVDEDAELVREIVGDWFPAGLVQHFERLTAQKRAELLQSMLFQGVDLPQSIRESGEETGVRGPLGGDWGVLLADYCQMAGGTDPWAVWNHTPWPWFLTLLSRREATYARIALRNARWAMIPHMGKAASKSLNELQRRSLGWGLGFTAPPAEPERDGMPALKKFLSSRWH